MLPTTVVHPIRPVDVPVNSPYFGYGSSNQCYRNSIQAPNLGPGQEEPKLQSDLYVPDNSDLTADLQTQITTIEADLANAVLAVGPVGTSPNANAAVIASQTLHLQPADNTNPGVITTGAQTIAGAKTFTGVLAASNLSGTNTGDLTLAAIGSSPNANGASLAGQVLTLQPADATSGGVVTNTTQSMAGDKTLTGNLTCNKGIYLPIATAGGDGIIYQNGNRLIYTWNGSNVYVGRSGNITQNPTTQTAVGMNALSNSQSIAARNCAFGYDALAALTTAGNCTAVGRSALAGVTTGGDNIGIGLNAGSAITTTSGNIFIGNDGVLGDAATIKIGTSQTKCAIAGISGRTSSAGVAVLVNSSGVLGTTTSSERFKENIHTLDNSVSAKLNQLRIVDFNYKDDPAKKIQYGVIAEEAAIPFPELAVYDNDDPNQPVNTIQYLSLIPLLIKELQVQKARIDELTSSTVA